MVEMRQNSAIDRTCFASQMLILIFFRIFRQASRNFKCEGTEYQDTSNRSRHVPAASVPACHLSWWSQHKKILAVYFGKDFSTFIQLHLKVESTMRSALSYSYITYCAPGSFFQIQFSGLVVLAGIPPWRACCSIYCPVGSFPSGGPVCRCILKSVLVKILIDKNAFWILIALIQLNRHGCFVNVCLHIPVIPVH